MSKILLSAFSDEYNRNIDEQIKMLSSRGLKYIEPRFIGEKNIANLTKCEADELARKLSSAGIGVSAIGSPLGKINLADDFSLHLDLAKNTFEVANTLGAKNIRMFSFYLRAGQSREDARAEVIEKLGKLLGKAPYMPALVISLGVPDEVVILQDASDVRPNGPISYYRDKYDHHMVPKISMSTLVLK